MRTSAISRTTLSVTQNRAEISVPAHRLVLVSNNAASSDAASRVHLTARQSEVLALLCEGLANKLICRRLNISAGTVKAHISSILRELGVSSRLQAVVWARRPGRADDVGNGGQDREVDIDPSEADHKPDAGRRLVALASRALLN